MQALGGHFSPRKDRCSCHVGSLSTPLCLCLSLLLCHSQSSLLPQPRMISLISLLSFFPYLFLMCRVLDVLGKAQRTAPQWLPVHSPSCAPKPHKITCAPIVVEKVWEDVSENTLHLSFFCLRSSISGLC